MPRYLACLFSKARAWYPVDRGDGTGHLQKSLPEVLQCPVLGYSMRQLHKGPLNVKNVRVFNIIIFYNSSRWDFLRDLSSGLVAKGFRGSPDFFFERKKLRALGCSFL